MDDLLKIGFPHRQAAGSPPDGPLDDDAGGGLDFALQFGALGNSAVTPHCATQGPTHCGSLTGFAERINLADAPREGAVEVIGDHPSSNMVAVAQPIGPTQNIVGQVTAQITAQITAQFAPFPSRQGLSQPLGGSKHGDGAGFSARPSDAAGGGHLTEHTQGTHGGGPMAPTHLISNPKSGLETTPHRVPLTDGATIAPRGGEIAVVQTNGDTTKSTGDMMAPPPTSWASQTGSLTVSTMEQTDAAHSHPLAARSARAIGSLTPQVDLSPREGFGPAGTAMAGSTDDARPAQAPPDPKQMPMTAPQATSEGSPPITVKSRHEGAFEHHVNTPKIGETLPLSQTHAPPALNTQDPERTDQPILRPAFSSTDDPRPTQTTSRGAPSDPVVPFPVSARLITQPGLTDAAASKASTPVEGQLRGAISPDLAQASAAATNIAQGLDPIQLPRQLAAQMVGEHTLPQAQVAPSSTHPVPPQMLLAVGAPAGTAPMSPTARDVGRITPAPSIEGGGGSLGLPIASSNAVVVGNVTGAAPAAPPPSTAQQIAAVATQVPHDGGAVELTLDPPELGRVRMSLNEIGGVMTLAIQADRSETADLMRRYIDHLHQEFQRAGLEPPQVRIFQDGAAVGRNPNGQPRDDNPHPGSAASQRFADDTPDPHLDPPHHPPGGSGLDLRI